MKSILITLFALLLFSCNRKVAFSDLKNENETYYDNEELYTGIAFSDIETETPSTKYEFNDGTKQTKTDFFPDSDKIKTKEIYSMGFLQRTEEYANDGLLLEKQEYVWNDSKDSVTVSIEWYDWCGKMKRRKSMECDKYFKMVNEIYDQDISQPCN